MNLLVDRKVEFFAFCEREFVEVVEGLYILPDFVMNTGRSKVCL